MDIVLMLLALLNSCYADKPTEPEVIEQVQQLDLHKAGGEVEELLNQRIPRSI